jgi:hypothetical protein
MAQTPTPPRTRKDEGLDQETGAPGRSPADAADPAADPGTNRTHPEPDTSADQRPADSGKYSEKSPHTAGQQ